MFGAHLRRLRLSRGLRQEQLAHAAEISARHLSFLETGRARPSRKITLRLSEALGVSASERNGLLRLAGYAPASAQGDLSPEEGALALAAVSQLLASQHPVPAVASDSLGYILDMNASAARFFEMIGGRPLSRGENLFELFFIDRRVRAAVTNWAEIAPGLLHHLEREALDLPDHSRARSLVAKLARHAGSPIQAGSVEMPIFRFDVRLGDQMFRFISNYTTFGAPYDATMQAIRIECFLPADESTRRLLEQTFSR